MLKRLLFGIALSGMLIACSGTGAGTSGEPLPSIPSVVETMAPVESVAP